VTRNRECDERGIDWTSHVTSWGVKGGVQTGETRSAVGGMAGEGTLNVTGDLLL
jgi:hypothetical protein